MATDSAGDEDFEKVDFDTITKSIKLIYKGSFGEVYGPFDWKSNKFAIKQIWISSDIPDDRDIESKVKNKGKLWTSLKHDNLIKIHYVSLRSSKVNLHIVMEYASGGSLRQLLNKSDVNAQHKKYVLTWARQLAGGMMYLHERNIVHRDLKSDNIVLMEPFDSLNAHLEPTLKITDFDTVQEHAGTTTMPSLSGTCAYMAPEVLTEQRFSKASDVWSYGVVMWEMLTCERPHRKQPVGPLVVKAISGELTLPIYESIPAEIKELLSECWYVDRKRRLSFKKIVDRLNSIRKNIAKPEQREEESDKSLEDAEDIAKPEQRRDESEWIFEDVTDIAKPEQREEESDKSLEDAEDIAKPEQRREESERIVEAVTDIAKPEQRVEESEKPLEDAEDIAKPEQRRDESDRIVENVTDIAKPEQREDESEKPSEDAEYIAKSEQREEESKKPLEDAESDKSNDPTSPYYEFRQQMMEYVVADLTYMLEDDTYSQIQKVIERPRIKEGELMRFWKTSFPYIIQRIKMWNGYVLTAQHITDLVIRQRKQKEVTTDSQLSGTIDRPLRKIERSGTSVYPVSRLDFLTYLINVADCIVANDILRIMSKFPMAIPLIVQDIHEDEKFIITVPIIRNIQIKWESTPGQIVENHLFSSPFRMVAAIRLGTNKIGKSTILNQLMSKHFLFSSKGEPGSRYGRPSTLDGAVEIVWLTQTTCSSPTWNRTMSDYYTQSMEEVIILANLHGNAFYNPEILTYLDKCVWSFIVFLMPDFSEKEWTQLRQCINCENIVQVFVDPHEDVDDENDMNTIRTDLLSSDDTMETMRCLLEESLGLNKKKTPACTRMEEDNHAYKSLRYAKSLQCKISEELISIVRSHGCYNIKQHLSNADFKELPKWDKSLKRLINLSLELLSLPTKDAKEHLAHLETNLSQISANESMAARAEVSEAKQKLRRILRVPNKTGNGESSKDSETEEDLKKTKQELDTAMNKFDNMSLGQEHIFRTLCHIYEGSLEVANLGKFAAFRDLPNQFANLLIHGHAIELLNGDSGKIQITWIRAICDNVLKKMPYLKVFVISIIGLQSSGKSTLLNALFSCRFAVSVGRCSRGLFMRMIFVDKTLKHSHGYDAIILIDTEGLSSPEKLNDPKSNQKDRLMATFAMGISNLTLVNILGEGMTEITEILQIAIVAMARLRVGGIKPDILMVQHLQERNISKMDQTKGQFCEAINKAFELISKNDVEIGSASAECLAELTARIHSGDLFQHFGPFKDGSSVNSPPSEGYHSDVVTLLETILKRAEVSNNKRLFERWCIHLECYWNCVQEEHFALNFKNVKHIMDFLYFEKKIAKVKELLDRAIRCHREVFSNNIRVEVSSHIAEGRMADSMHHRKYLFDSIEQHLELIPHSCPDNCKACGQFNDSHAALLEELSDTEWKEDTIRSVEKYNARLHEITMKMLTQTFDGSLVRQGCFSEFSNRIATELRQSLLKRPSGIYSPEEQKVIVANIWEYLQDVAAGMEGGPDHLEEKFSQTLQQEYSGIFPNVVKDFKNEVTVGHLANSKAIKSLWNMVLPGNWEYVKYLNPKLSENQMKTLVNTINHLTDTVFGNRCVDVSKTGLAFEEGMVNDIKAEFPEKIKQFEDTFRIKLHDKFKIDLQMYLLQQLKKKVMELQKLWDSQNKPTEILKHKKQDYITEIETRLKSGFSSAGEGEVVATKLYNAVKKIAIQAGYDETLKAIKDMSWTTNSETVRLCYFEELAIEVAAGKKDRALRHFKSPKVEIEKWYKHRVDSFDAKERVLEMYESTLKTELTRLSHKLLNSNSEVDVRRIVEEHIKSVDDRYYSKLDPKDHNFDAFRESVVCKLKDLCEMDDRENATFPLGSDDPEIMGRLGCTEACYFCGALCWGSRDHQLRKDTCPEIEKHHSCHQPTGLVGVLNKLSKLQGRACHNTRDNGRVWLRECHDDKGMSWLEAKINHFKEWNFDVHCITTFDELMRWFFQELHQDIAKSEQVLAADDKDLKKHKCTNLKLCDILNVVRNKI